MIDMTPMSNVSEVKGYGIILEKPKKVSLEIIFK